MDANALVDPRCLGRDVCLPILYQAEWCPSSHRVRQRLTELGVAFVAIQVPVEHERRRELVAATGSETIPVLVHDGAVIVGVDDVVSYLDRAFGEGIAPADARAHSAKARSLAAYVSGGSIGRHDVAQRRGG